MPDLLDARIGFVGAGNMAEALVRGLLRAELVRPERIIASDPNEARREVFTRIGVTATSNSADLADCQVLVLAVKPQILSSVLTELAGILQPGRLVVSIAAGWRTEHIASALPESIRIVRVMPNTPMLVGSGIAGVAQGPGATEEDVDFVCRLFDAAGETIRADESQMDALTAVSGTGPAYVFRFVEALTHAAIQQGLSEEMAYRLACRTTIGAARLLDETDEPAEVLRRRVTSPGGTTEAAIKCLNEDDIDTVMARAVDAAFHRSVELSTPD